MTAVPSSTGGEVVDDFDAVIAAAVKKNKSCASSRCKNSTALLGQDCVYCRQRFCLSHHIAEAHGCGEAARVAARRTISREGVLHPGSGVPSKLPDPTKRKHLERRLEKKIGELEKERTTKQKEKKKE